MPGAGGYNAGVKQELILGPERQAYMVCMEGKGGAGGGG